MGDEVQAFLIEEFNARLVKGALNPDEGDGPLNYRSCCIASKSKDEEAL